MNNFKSHFSEHVATYPCWLTGHSRSVNGTLWCHRHSVLFFLTWWFTSMPCGASCCITFHIYIYIYIYVCIYIYISVEYHYNAVPYSMILFTSLRWPGRNMTSLNPQNTPYRASYGCLLVMILQTNDRVIGTALYILIYVTREWSRYPLDYA